MADVLPMKVYKNEFVKVKAELGNKGQLETGPIGINDDFPSIHLRGDHAVYYAVMIKRVLANAAKAESEKDIVALNALGDLVTLFQSCDLIYKEDRDEDGK